MWRGWEKYEEFSFKRKLNVRITCSKILYDYVRDSYFWETCSFYKFEYAKKNFLYDFLNFFSNFKLLFLFGLPTKRLGDIGTFIDFPRIFLKFPNESPASPNQNFMENLLHPTAIMDEFTQNIMTYFYYIWEMA